MNKRKSKKALEQIQVVSRELNTYGKVAGRYGVDDEALYCYLSSLECYPEEWDIFLTKGADRIFRLLLEGGHNYSQEEVGGYDDFIGWIREDLIKLGYARNYEDGDGFA